MRDEFPIFAKHPELIYLDTAATAHKPSCVIDAITRAYAEDYATVHRAIYKGSMRATEQYNETRETAARFVGAENAQEIVFTKGTTDAINLVAQGLKNFLSPGDEILISEMEHHSNIVPWQMFSETIGAKLCYIEVSPQGELLWQDKITPKTKIVSLAHMSNVTGTVNPIREISAVCKQVGALLVVDGAQAAAHLKIDVQSLGCDFYAFSGHKCYGPNGVGVLWGRYELLEKMPPIQGGGDMIEQVFMDRSTYQKPPLCFEAGTPAIVPVIALKTALDFVDAHRQDKTPLLTLATQMLLDIPKLHILGTAPNKGPVLSFTVEGVHPMDIATLLDANNVAIRSGHLCAQPLLRKFGLTSVCRASFGLYNTITEVEQFVSHLKRALHLLT